MDHTGWGLGAEAGRGVAALCERPELPVSRTPESPARSARPYTAISLWGLVTLREEGESTAKVGSQIILICRSSLVVRPQSTLRPPAPVMLLPVESPT